MTTFRIVEVRRDEVYVIATRPDGSTFGQIVALLRGSTEQELLDQIASCVSERSESEDRTDVRALAKHAGKEFEVDINRQAQEIAQ
jgi:hypothetical protein